MFRLLRLQAPLFHEVVAAQREFFLFCGELLPGFTYGAFMLFGLLCNLVDVIKTLHFQL